MQVVAELLRYAGRTFDAHRLSLLVADEPGGRLTPFVSDYASGATDQELFDEWRTLDVEEFDLVRRLRAGEDEIRLARPDGPGGLPARVVEQFDMRPLVALSLRSGEFLEGVLVIEGEPGQLDALADAGRVLRDHLDDALANVRAQQREVTRAQQSAGLLEVTRVLARTTQLIPVMVAVARQSARLAGFERCSIFLVDEEEHRIIPTMSQFADGHDDPAAWQRFISTDADLPAVWEVLRTRQPILVEDPADRPDLLPPAWFEPFDIATLVYVPLVAWDECFGVLVLDHRQPTTISDEQLALAEAVAGQGAVAISIGRLLDRLRRTNDDLERAVRTKDDFLSMVSHELRNPATSILGFAATLERAWDHLDPDRRRELLARIRLNAERQERMIEDLLQSSRIVSGDLRVRLRTVPLGPLVEDAVANLRLPDGVADVRVDGRLVHADPDHVRQIVVNLLTNAEKYGRPPFELVSEASEEVVRLRVRDHGDGVPDEFVPLLFERFTQAHLENRAGARGVGLGLSIARRMAQASGGDLRYEDTADGPTFVLELPAGNVETAKRSREG